MDTQHIHQPQLEGGSFFWESGERGVLLIHDLGATTSMVRPLARHLYNWGYGINGPLLPGHGTIPDALLQITWKSWMEAVEQAYAGLKERTRRVAVAGEGLGALLALLLAERHAEIGAVMCFAPAFKALPLSERVRMEISAAVNGIHERPIPEVSGWQGYREESARSVLERDALRNEVLHHAAALSAPILWIKSADGTDGEDEPRQMFQARTASKTSEELTVRAGGGVLLLTPELEGMVQTVLDFLQKHLTIE